jgi:regulator of sigma E protease
MDILYKVVSSPLSYALPFLFVLSLVVFFHELGHFLVARWCGIRVLVFSIGFGPELFGFNDRKGTRWKISAVPLGGYVKFLGDENAASVPDTAAAATMSAEDRAQSFFHKPVGARAAVVVAGPLANFLLAIVILAGVALIAGERTITPLPRVDEVMDNSAASRAGFHVGDVVRSIDGQDIHTFADMQAIVSGSANRALKIVVDRDGGLVPLTATPTEDQGKTVLGIKHAKVTPEEVKIETVGPIEAVRYGVDQTWTIITSTLSGILGIVTFKESASQLGGPIMIAQLSHQVAAEGFIELLKLAALLSTSIGLLNLFPIPLLDGGHLLFYAIETVRGRPLSERAQEVGFRIGLAIVLVLMVLATKNDITRGWFSDPTGDRPAADGTGQQK